MKNPKNKTCQATCLLFPPIGWYLYIGLLLVLTSCSSESDATSNTIMDADNGPDISTDSVPEQLFEFNVNTNDPEIEMAIAYTLDIWSNYLETDATIRVNIVFLPDLSGFLGRSIPNGIKNFDGAPLQDVWYPLSLANAISGSSLKPNEFDMDILIASEANWYFGVDGNPGANQFDFVTSLLHEICHSLGFGSLAGFEEGVGRFGNLQPNGYVPSFPIPDLEGLPGIYDLYLATTQMGLITNTSLFPSNSIALGEALTSDALFFSGSEAKMENDGANPKLFAPSVFLPGSSISHLDEGSFSAGDSNRLMEPFFIPEEVIHEPGPLVLAVLKDVGWTIKNSNQ
ncbi:MAG: hypothetical protein AAF717_05215 [Bacteroidota bacterium]